MGRMSSCHSAKLWALRQIKNGKDQDGPKLVELSGLEANQLYQFADAIQWMNELFDAPMIVCGKAICSKIAFDRVDFNNEQKTSRENIMKPLVFRMPIQGNLPEPYQLKDGIILVPSEKMEWKRGQGVFYCSSMYYTEDNYPLDQTFPSVPVPSYENLRDFVIFWSFVMEDVYPLEAFESAEWSPEIKNLPNINPSKWANNPKILNLDSFNIESGLVISERSYKLTDIFQLYSSADKRLKDLILLSTYHPNRHVADRRRIAYQNYYLRSFSDWIIFDALAPVNRCSHSSICPECNVPASISHPKVTQKERLRELFKHFEDAEKYAELIIKLNKNRKALFHAGSYADLPATEFPSLNAETLVRHRAMTMEDTLVGHGTEGLATENALNISKMIARCLLLNKLIPDLNLWPSMPNITLAMFNT